MQYHTGQVRVVFLSNGMLCHRVLLNHWMIEPNRTPSHWHNCEIFYKNPFLSDTQWGPFGSHGSQSDDLLVLIRAGLWQGVLISRSPRLILKIISMSANTISWLNWMFCQCDICQIVIFYRNWYKAGLAYFINAVKITTAMVHNFIILFSVWPLAMMVMMKIWMLMTGRRHFLPDSLHPVKGFKLCLTLVSTVP